MKKIKFVFIICICLSVILCAFCACLPNRTRKCTIKLHIGTSPTHYVGDFNVTKSVFENGINYIGIRKQDKNDFIDMIKSSNLYRGELELKQCGSTNYLNTHKEKINNICHVFAYEDEIWLGRFYAQKYFKIIEVHQVVSFLTNNDNYFPLNLMLFCDNIRQEDFIKGYAYSTPWSWEELKLLFNNSTVDENNHTIQIIRTFYYSPPITVQIIYNEENSTICINELQM